MPEHAQPGHALEAVVRNKRGLHARAAARVATLSETLGAEVFFTFEGQTVSTLSIMGMMMLGAASGAVLLITGSGDNAGRAVEQVAALVNAGFNETD